MSDLISKEQAIKAMQESEFGFTYEVDVAIEAVKALPTVEPEGMGKMSENLISRKEMIRAVDSLGEDYISYYKLLLLIGKMPSAEPERIIKIGQRSGKTLESAIDYLHSVGWLQEHDRILTESAEPERKKGKWVDGMPYVNSHWRVCSVCHETAPNSAGGYNFCPNCGADMKGE